MEIIFILMWSAFGIMCLLCGWLILTELGCLLSFEREVDNHIEEIKKGNDTELPKCEHIF